jgi:hypothetical protein
VVFAYEFQPPAWRTLNDATDTHGQQQSRGGGRTNAGAYAPVDGILHMNLVQELDLLLLEE